MEHECAIREVARLVAEAIKEGNSIYVFGDKIGADFKELLYRETKGLALINPIWHEGLIRVIATGVHFEEEFYSEKFKKEDMIFIVEPLKGIMPFLQLGILAREFGVTVVVLTPTLCPSTVDLKQDRAEISMIGIRSENTYILRKEEYTTGQTLVNIIKKELISKSVGIPTY